jgi:hydroxymethylpyrimidine/phosphomethylpyrimidine kinase
MAGRDRRARRKRATPKREIEQRAQTIPVALTIAGSDCSAGAGIQADLKTFSALGVYGLTAVTCVVAEIPGKVSKIEPVAAEIVSKQVEVLAKSLPIAAIKTGMLYSAEIISTVARAMRDLGQLSVRPVPLVVDPVFVATSGDLLVDPEAVATYERELFPLAGLITPNLHEAERLTGTEIRDRQSMRRVGKQLEERFRTGILLKGGHLEEEEAVDLLFANDKVVEFSALKVLGVATHGTGCTYSAAITAGLARGLSLEKAVGRAKKFVTESIRNHFEWDNLHALRHSS